MIQWYEEEEEEEEEEEDRDDKKLGVKMLGVRWRRAVAWHGVASGWNEDE